MEDTRMKDYLSDEIDKYVESYKKRCADAGATLQPVIEDAFRVGISCGISLMGKVLAGNAPDPKFNK